MHKTYPRRPKMETAEIEGTIRLTGAIAARVCHAMYDGAVICLASLLPQKPLSYGQLVDEWRLSSPFGAGNAKINLPTTLYLPCHHKHVRVGLLGRASAGPAAVAEVLLGGHPVDRMATIFSKN
jgi:hypothetical protein